MGRFEAQLFCVLVLACAGCGESQRSEFQAESTESKSQSKSKSALESTSNPVVPPEFQGETNLELLRRAVHESKHIADASATAYALAVISGQYGLAEEFQEGLVLLETAERKIATISDPSVQATIYAEIARSRACCGVSEKELGSAFHKAFEAVERISKSDDDEWKMRTALEAIAIAQAVSVGLETAIETVRTQKADDRQWTIHKIALELARIKGIVEARKALQLIARKSDEGFDLHSQTLEEISQILAERHQLAGALELISGPSSSAQIVRWHQAIVSAARAGDFSEAMTATAKLAGTFSEFSTYSAIAAVAIDHGNRKVAADAMNRALQLVNVSRSRGDNAISNLARVQMTLSGVRHSVQLVIDRGSSSGEKSDALFQIAKAQYTSGNRSEAKAIAQHALAEYNKQEHPVFTPVGEVQNLLNLAMVLHEVGDVANSKSFLEIAKSRINVVEEFAEKPIRHVGIAAIQIRLGNREEARKTMEKAIELAALIPEPYPMQTAIEEIAVLAAESGNFDSAKAVLAKVADPLERNSAIVNVARRLSETDHLEAAVGIVALLPSDIWIVDVFMELLGKPARIAGKKSLAESYNWAIKFESPMARLVLNPARLIYKK